MSACVVGIDFSMTKCGVAVATRHDTETLMHGDVVMSAGHLRDSIPDRHRRLTAHARGILDLALAADLAVIEGPSFGSLGGSQLDRYAGWWFVVGGLVRREVPVAVMSPSSVKLAIAGKGNADKAAVASAVTRLWPDVEIGSSDLSDAIALAHLGCVHLGWDVPTLERHRQVKAAWPAFPEAVA